MEIIDALDQERLVTFTGPCDVIMENIESFEREIVYAADAIAALGIGNAEITAQFLQEKPDSLFAPLVRRRLEELRGQ